MKCWLVSDGECGMLCHGETRSQAISQFIGCYTDCSYDDYARGDLRITTRRIPEHDDNTSVEYDAYAVIRRGYWVYCETPYFQCGQEGLVASIEEWEPINPDDPVYQGYLIDGKVLCPWCAGSHAVEANAIQRTAAQ